MEQKRRDRIRKTLKRQLAAEAEETLRKVQADFRDPPEAMQYFYKVFRRWADPAAFCDASGMLIATTCTQVPLELILACGARPLRLCNASHALDQAGAELLPAKTCTLVKASAGMLSIFQDAFRHRLGLIVAPAACDAKRKASELLAELGVPVHPLAMPSSKNTPEAAFYWQETVGKLALRLSQVTGRRITRRRLSAAVHKVRLASGAFRWLSRLQRHCPPVVHGTDTFIVANAFLYDDIDRWTAALVRLNTELEARAAAGRCIGRHAPRILLTGSPPMAPGLKIPLLVEDAGAVIVADEVCSCSRLLYDPVPRVEPCLYDLIPAIADRYLKPCTCPIYDSGDDRRRKLLELVRRCAVDGVVHPVYSGCQLYQIEQRPVGMALREAGVPVLFVETDASPEDRGQLATRIEAFVESIQAGRKGEKTCGASVESTSVQRPSKSYSSMKTAV